MLYPKSHDELFPALLNSRETLPSKTVFSQLQPNPIMSTQPARSTGSCRIPRKWEQSLPQTHNEPFEPN